MEKTQSDNIVIIGGGHIGVALVDGLIAGGVRTKRITVIGRTHSSLLSAKKRGVAVSTDLRSVIKKAAIVFLAVRPNVLLGLLDDLKTIKKSTILVSLSAGVSMRVIQSRLPGIQVSRVMPNLPIGIGEGVLGVLYGNLSRPSSARLRALLSKLGLVVEVDSEEELSTVTLIGGCGPGIVASFIVSLAKEATRHGITPKDSETIALQVVKGTIDHIESGRHSASEYAQAVQTKGGVTERIVKTLVKSGFNRSLAKALVEGRRKIRSLS